MSVFNANINHLHFSSSSRVIVKQEKGKKNSDFLIPKSNSTRALPISIGNDNVAEIYGPEYGLIYLLKTPQDPLLHIHLYECEKYEQVSGNRFWEVILLRGKAPVAPMCNFQKLF